MVVFYFSTGCTTFTAATGSIMRFSFFAFIIPCLFLLSCNGGDSKKKVPDNVQQPVTPVKKQAVTDWYRRYTGTIAGQPVILNLYHFGNDEMSGSYCYTDRGIIIDLYRDNDSSTGGTSYIYESVPTSRADGNDYHNNAHWQVNVTGDRISGKWISRNRSKQLDIDLKEDYTGAQQFEVKLHDDSLGITKNGVVVAAQASFLLTLPAAETAKEDAEFINTALLKSIGGKKAIGKTITDYFLSTDKAYFKDYKETVDSSNDIDSTQVQMYSYDRSDNLSVIYNYRGWLIYELLASEYMGGAHGMYGMSYVCIDMQNRKVWGLKDIMNIDTARLGKIIEQEARKEFGIPRTDSLNLRMLVDTIPVTDNIYFTHTGIVFSYTPYEIASYADGQVSFFIPFTHLKDMLTPEFKKRMGL